MANEDKPDVNDNAANEARSDNRMMWISTAVIVLIIVGGMGINMLIHHDTGTNPVETSSPPN